MTDKATNQDDSNASVITENIGPTISPITVSARKKARKRKGEDRENTGWGNCLDKARKRLKWTNSNGNSNGNSHGNIGFCLGFVRVLSGCWLGFVWVLFEFCSDFVQFLNGYNLDKMKWK